MNDWQIEAWLRPAATALAAASIVLVLVNAALIVRNDRAQVVLNQRQQVINQGAQLSRAAQFLVQTIARTAITSKDDALVALLERHGVRLQPNPPPAAAPETGK